MHTEIEKAVREGNKGSLFNSIVALMLTCGYETWRRGLSREIMRRVYRIHVTGT